MNRPASRARVSAQRYDEIVQIAGELFAAKGFDGTSLFDIAEAVGVLRGSLYHYITSKEDLLYDVIQVMHERLTENMRICDAFADDPRRQLAAFAYNHITLNADTKHHSRGIVFWRDSDKLNAEKRDLIVRDRDAYERYLRKLLKKGQMTGVFDPNMDLRLATFGVIGLITSHMRWFKPGGPISARQLAREFTALALAAVAPPPDGSPDDRYALIDELITRFPSG